MKRAHVGVLMGGCSSERDISLRSGKAMLEALQSAGVHASALDLRTNWPQTIQGAGIDTAVITLHGTLGEDGCIQGLLEIMRIPYTGSGVTASALCMHKPLCKAVLNQAGLKTPTDIAIGEDGPIRYPVVLKPVAEGSSIGLHILQNATDWQRLNIRHPATWMAEMPVQGPEVAVSVLNGRALPPVEVAPRSGTYDFEAKYTTGATQYFCPARIPAESLKLCMQRAEEAVRLTGCRGAPRVDMILADGGEPVILEINTIPGMTETSLLPKAAAEAGIGFADLCMRILEAATLDSTGGAA